MVQGQLEGTRSLPPHGKGYRTYSYFGSALGRQYAHHKVIQSLEDAFSVLHDKTGQTFDIAEIGAKHGGKFLPHFTHRKGLSVDIMTPMKSGDKPARLGTGPLSLWGYCWHIDEKTNRQNGLKWDAPSTSKYPKLCPTIPIKSEKEVDFDVMRDMIVELQRAAKKNGGRLAFVIVAPSFVPHLQGLGVRLSTKASLVHDDHIHVEFVF
jgi:penicillin-insensitive murein endopeptidase